MSPTPLSSRLWDSYVLLVRHQTNERNQQIKRERLSAAGKRGMWRRWNRERVIETHMPMVERIAKDVRRLFARHIDIRDLIQAGNVGLVSAANSYHPSKGAFEPYAYFRVRGAIIDSQKRRAYREEGNQSLDAISDAYNGWLPPKLDTDARPLADEILSTAQVNPAIVWAISGLSGQHREVFLAHVEGSSPREISAAKGISLSSTRVFLNEARVFVAHRLKSRGFTN